MSWRPKKTVTALIVGIAISLTATACAGGDSGSDPDAPTVRLGVGIDTAYAPFFVADKAGYFEEEGVNAEIVQFAVGGEAVDALGAGEVHMVGNSDTTTSAMMASNDKLRALVAHQSSDRHVKAVLREGIESPDQVEVMGYVPGLSQIAAERFLADAGVETSSVEWVQGSPADIPALLRRGDIDGFVMWEPWPSMAEDQGIGRVVARSGDFGFAYHHWLLTNADWLADNEETAQKVTRAMDRATQRIAEDPEFAAEATQEAVNIAPEDALAAIEEIDFEVLNLTPESIEGTEELIDFYENLGVISSRPDLETMMLLDWYKGLE